MTENVIVTLWRSTECTATVLVVAEPPTKLTVHLPPVDLAVHKKSHIAAPPAATAADAVPPAEHEGGGAVRLVEAGDADDPPADGAASHGRWSHSDAA